MRQYQIDFPKDETFITDAHEFLRCNYGRFDFIWSSPPCPTHSKLAMSWRGRKDAEYPDMRLYQEILLLWHFCGKRQKWCVENVVPYYEPLVAPTVKLGRHLFWTNFDVPEKYFEDGTQSVSRGKVKACSAGETIDMMYKAEKWGFDYHGKFKGGYDRRLAIRNMTNPEIAEYILQCAMGEIAEERWLDEMSLFAEVDK